MIWEDALLSVAQAGFTLALIPTWLGEEKPAAATSLITVVLLILCAIALWSLGARYAALLDIICATVWFVLFIQKCRRMRRLVP